MLFSKDVLIIIPPKLGPGGNHNMSSGIDFSGLMFHDNPWDLQSLHVAHFVYSSLNKSSVSILSACCISKYL